MRPISCRVRNVTKSIFRSTQRWITLLQSSRVGIAHRASAVSTVVGGQCPPYLTCPSATGVASYKSCVGRHLHQGHCIRLNCYEMSGFAMAVAKGWQRGDRRKVCCKRGLWSKNGPMVLRAVRAGKRQNLGGFATRWFGGAGKNGGLPRWGVAKPGGFCNENAGKHGFSLQNSAARKWQTVAPAEVSGRPADEFRKAGPWVLQNQIPPAGKTTGGLSIWTAPLRAAILARSASK